MNRYYRYLCGSGIVMLLFGLVLLLGCEGHQQPVAPDSEQLSFAEPRLIGGPVTASFNVDAEALLPDVNPTGRLLGPNLLNNGDFEASNTGFTSDYTYSQGDIRDEGSYDVVYDPQDSHPLGGSIQDHTSGTGLMLAANGAADTTRAVWRQSVVVAMNTTYEFSGWAASWGDVGTGRDPHPATLIISINGSDIGPAFQLTDVDGDWQRFSHFWNSVAAVVAVIEIRLQSGESRGNDPAFDDFEFAESSPPIPTVTVSPYIEVCWQSLSGVGYQLQRAPSPNAARWFNVGGPIVGDGLELCAIDRPEGFRNRVYRVLVLPQQGFPSSSYAK